MSFNWAKCLICQEDKPECTLSPLLSTNPNSARDSYQSFLQYWKLYRDNGIEINVEISTETTIETLVENRGLWHKSCKLKFTNYKVNRAIARKRNREEDSGTDEDTIAVRKRTRFDVSLCVFCQEEKRNEPLHEVQTMEASQTIQSIAIELQDVALISRLSGDQI